MNCLDFRRQIYQNPRLLDEECRLHSAECAACRDFLEKQRELDAELFTALQVPAPDGLADRILVAQGARPSRRRWLWAAAATLVAGVGSVALFRTFIGRDPLGIEAIEHVAHEPQSFTTIHTVGNDYLPALLSRQGLRAAASLGQVSYTRVCPMAGLTAQHLVLRTAQGPVTLFMLPERAAGRRSLTEKDGMAALVLPATPGTVAVVASSPGQALAVEKALQRA
jgi:hypothetical protein